MKFEKFFKSVGTHGLIVKRSESESWLLCGGVGMRIPNGVNNLGVSVDPEPLFNAIVSSVSEDDVLFLSDAILPYADGKANDIVRVFETDLGDKVGISNKEYGLLEKSDILTYLEVEDEANMTHKILVVRDFADSRGDVIGFITGGSI